MSSFSWTKLAIPGVSILISVLAYGSQILFPRIEPGPLTNRQKWTFNVLVACIWICYARAVLVDPGHVPAKWTADTDNEDYEGLLVRQRFCRKCQALKPQRSHHCKVCRRCVPKMDHHCPWTANCVSHKTFPHFMRFLFYAVVSMVYLESLLYDRAAAVWKAKDLRYDMGPSVPQLTSLFLLLLLNTLTVFMVGITFFRSCYALCCNVTTIESWEIERHEQLLRRSKVFGGYLDGPDGTRVRIVRQEFPFDIGFWRNICAGMGTSNFLAWLWPFARTPSTDGLTFETNGFEDPGSSWPPPDPDRVPRKQRQEEAMDAFTYTHASLSNREEIEAFRKRQEEDIRRRQGDETIQKRKAFHSRFDPNTSAPLEDVPDNEAGDMSGEEGWQDSGGNRLKDYGVDEDIEFYDEDDIPLAELLRRRRQKPRSD